VRERVDAWQALAEERGVRLRAETAGDTSASVTGGRLEQVLDNLLANALEVAPTGSAIRVAAARADGLVTVSVADEGPGMSEADRARAFDRFWRAGQGEGFGLGLPIVRRLVEADGGTVELRAVAPHGLEAVVRLPAATDAAPPEADGDAA
jgi:signal transduction histidine kinase